MKIDKAIEILDFLIGPGMPRIDLDEREAIKLGKEALIRWKRHRQKFKAWEHDFLPGETEEY